MAFPVSKRFGHRYREKVRTQKKLPFNATALIDMFIIIIIFLLQSYVNEGVIPTMTEDIILPKIITHEVLKSYSAMIKVSNDQLSFRNNVLLDFNDSTKFKSLKIDTLMSELLDYKQEIDSLTVSEDALSTEQRSKISGMITIIGDQRTHYRIMKRIIYTCYSAGYSNVFFASERSIKNEVSFH